MGDAVGTHFVRSITYGGEMIASIRMECNSTKDKQRIKGAIDVGGRIEIFDLGLEGKKTWVVENSSNIYSLILY